MNKIQRPINIHKAYHAHVYFNDENKTMARRLCDEAGTTFNVKVGRFHEKLVGPHPMWSCQISFEAKHFDALIPWLDEKREGLTILIHALTDDSLKDHTEYAYWLGQSVDLHLDIFKT